jgi:hypothetical protein
MMIQEKFLYSSILLMRVFFEGEDRGGTLV